MEQIFDRNKENSVGSSGSTFSMFPDVCSKNLPWPNGLQKVACYTMLKHLGIEPLLPAHFTLSSKLLFRQRYQAIY